VSRDSGFVLIPSVFICVYLWFNFVLILVRVYLFICGWYVL